MKTHEMVNPVITAYLFLTSGLSSKAAPWRKSRLTNAFSMNGFKFLFNPTVTVDPLYPPPASYGRRDGVA